MTTKEALDWLYDAARARADSLDQDQRNELTKALILATWAMTKHARHSMQIEPRREQETRP